MSPVAPPAESKIAQIGSGEGFTYEDGLRVQVLSAKRFTPSDTAAGAQPGQTGVKVAVRITNGTSATVDLALVQVELQAGNDGVEAEQVYDTEQGIGSGFNGSVAPNRNATASFGFAVNRADLSKLNVQVTPGFNYQTSIFEGSAS